MAPLAAFTGAGAAGSTGAVSATSTMLRQHNERLGRWPQPLRMDIRVGVASGEVVDVDGITGGYNFQHAWSSGWIAANSITSANKN